MKKLFILVLALASTVITAQKKEKIKGNREVLIKKFDIPSFKEIEVGEKFEIGLEKASDTTRIVIETDDNLFDVIHFSVDGDVLKFSTSMDIVKKKRLKITVFVPEDFNKIHLTEKAKVYNEERMTLKNLKLKTTEKTEADLNLIIKEILEIEASDKSELKIEAYAQDAYLHITENASLEAKLEVQNIEVNLDDHADCKLQGNAEFIKADVQVKADLQASDFKTKDGIVSVKDKASLTISVSGEVDLKLSGESQTYIYGSPKINLKIFKDNAILYKK